MTYSKSSKFVYQNFATIIAASERKSCGRTIIRIHNLTGDSFYRIGSFYKQNMKLYENLFGFGEVLL